MRGRRQIVEGKIGTPEMFEVGHNGTTDRPPDTLTIAVAAAGSGAGMGDHAWSLIIVE
jgi:hypothetical protein